MQIAVCLIPLESSRKIIFIRCVEGNSNIYLKLCGLIKSFNFSDYNEFSALAHMRSVSKQVK